MDYVINHTLKQVDGENYLIIHLNPDLNEFANEFQLLKYKKEDLTHFIYRLKALYPNIKISAVKLMIGSMLVSTLPVYGQTINTPNEHTIMSEQQQKQTNNRFNMSYVYFGSLNNQYEYLSYAEHSLQVISPSYFDINIQGNLTLNTHLLNRDFITNMQNKGIKVVPFVSNHFHRPSGVLALQNYEALAEELAYYVHYYNLDGINVDIENVTHNERDLYTAFVKKLRELIPKHKEVSVAVAANPKNWTQGWHGSYDYKALAQYSDYLMIMAYDEHYYGSVPGPVASSSFVEASIQYALKHVPANQIVLGLPFYGRYWKSGETIGGHGIHLTQVERMKQLYEHQVTYDPIARSPKVEITIKANDPPTTLFGKVLSPGKYTIWYENDDSIKHKLSLVQKYNLKGTGSWSVGQEPSHIWSYYDLWLNSQYFQDIETSWAKDEILNIVKKNWMVGLDTHIFQPTSNLTRAEAATLLTRALNLQPNNDSNITFTDIEGHWAEINIKTIANYGLMIGYDNKFSPDQPLTREEISMLLYRIIDLTNKPKNHTFNFSDVPPEKWSYEPISRMAQAGILKGYGDTTFRPTQAIKREEMASLLLRIADELEHFTP